MPTPYDDYQKTGMDKAIKFAKILCGIVQTFEPIIRAKFPDNGAIIALLEAIKSVCTLLPAADAEFQQYQLDQTMPPADAEDAAGIDPSAPAAVPPDFT